MKTHKISRIAITPGEPAGIGPDLVLQLSMLPCKEEWIAVADPALLAARAKYLNLPLKIQTVDLLDAPKPHEPGVLKVFPILGCQSFIPQLLSLDNVPYTLQTLKTATVLCLEGVFQALVTGPVHKGIINQAGVVFSGHTEFFAALCHIPKVVMLMSTEGLNVALATTHLPLKAVAGAITAEHLREVILILHREFGRQFKIENPRIAVCGLNPHAGEGGHLGDEEIKVITPVLNALRQKGLNLKGPISADTIFTEAHLKSVDVVLAMYHDQGLPVLKMKGFGQAANITLGLPFVRTSVDHGTALDLAGTGKASLSSLLYALNYAIRLIS